MLTFPSKTMKLIISMLPSSSIRVLC